MHMAAQNKINRRYPGPDSDVGLPVEKMKYPTCYQTSFGTAFLQSRPYTSRHRGGINLAPVLRTIYWYTSREPIVSHENSYDCENCSRHSGIQICRGINVAIRSCRVVMSFWSDAVYMDVRTISLCWIKFSNVYTDKNGYKFLCSFYITY